ncbi:RND family efflux transporter MFP subunit [Bradymonas sediminis]|uniref:YknX-like C-terminal permuted SH3-like domain-containing protein n=1 Tax=Bradymonas sediminis TaxID=1548548 RepID=A0A2Z4FIF6_9DELT|nr:hypothetical protein DN745_05500 [Bradymonas sediminis]TDP71822.1 RND family efflux transporter MFP subunit [Bradymonas sediminis]
MRMRMQLSQRSRPKTLQANTCLQVSLRAAISRILLLGALLALPHLGCSTEDAAPQPTAQTPPLAIRVAPVLRRDLRHALSYIGTVHAQREVKILARIPGTLQWLADEGSKVAQGKPVAIVAADEMSAKIARVDAEVRRVGAERDLRCTTYERDQSLGDDDAIPKSKVDMSRSACDTATAALDAARASAREARVGNQKTRENAPMSGRVLQRLAEPGQNIMPGMPLLLFGGDATEIRVPVAQTDRALKIQPGTPVRVQFGPKLLDLSVSAVAPLAMGPGRTTEVRIHLPEDAPSSLQSGMAARVDFVLEEQMNTLAIPENALWEFGAKSAVFVVDAGSAREVAVEPGIREDGWVQVSADIAADAKVAVSNLDMLKDGARVFAVDSQSLDSVAGDEVLP